MKLNKRLLFVILPITLACACAVSYIAYKSLLERTIQLEEKTLDARMAELSTKFKQYHSYAKSYMYSTTSSRLLMRYIENENDYRELSVRSGFGATLSHFNYSETDYISLTIVEPNEKGFNELLSIVRSEDPFAEPYAKLSLFSGLLLRDRQTARWDYFTTRDGMDLLVFTQLIDRFTYEPPMANRTEDSISVQLAIAPTDYNTLLDKFLADYPAKIEPYKKESELPEHKYKVNIEVGDRESQSSYLQISVDDGFYANKVQQMLINFILFGGAFIVSYIALTVALIRRYIVTPISQLQSNIVAIGAGQQEAISYDESLDDEINSLARSFSSLHSRLSQSYKEVAEINERDALTGLYNFPYVSKEGPKLLQKSMDLKQEVAVFYIDLDNFKFVNDQYGHHKGDELLQRFSQRLTSKFRNDRVEQSPEEEDLIISRLGGDEFCVIYRGDVSEVSLTSIAKRILSIFESGFSIDHSNFPVTASVGIALYPENGDNISELISAADAAMYSAKSLGKNQYSYYNHELWLAMNRRLAVENALKHCDLDAEFQLVYMPLVSTRTAQIAGFEALVRWHSSELGHVSPAEFVPIAESCGLFTKIDEWVVRTGFKEYASISKLLPWKIKLSINLSSAQLNLNTLHEHIEEQSSVFGVDPKNIQFEITETLNIDFDIRAHQFLNGLIDQGYTIAIDDFGTGYTSLMQLVEFPADIIKFDKTFIDKAMEDDKKFMLRPLVEFCHSQRCEVTVEGVETHEQAVYLSSIGFDYLQGYHYGKPVNLKSLGESIEEHQHRLDELAATFQLDSNTRDNSQDTDINANIVEIQSNSKAS